MMRFQRVSPDCLPLSSGGSSSKKPGLRTPTCKEDDNGEQSRTAVPSHTTSNGTANIEGKNFRFRSPSRSQDHHHHHHSNGGSSSSPLYESRRHDSSPSPSPSRGTGDVLLQWGQKKRARVPRMVSDDSSSSGQGAKVQKKASQLTPRGSMTDKPSTTTTAMPPPLPPPPASDGRLGALRKENSGILPSRNNLDERSGVVSRSPSRNGNGSSRVASRSAGGKRSPPSPSDKSEKKIPCSGSAKDEKANGCSDHRKRVDSTAAAAAGQSEQEPGNNNKAAAEKSNAEVVEWPRIYVALSRKEKEDDFLAMKGTKLPHRPKKRAKNIDRALQYCFPGMWLSDLTKSRYEVREKKCVKKQQQKKRGLKGLESMDSDSE